MSSCGKEPPLESRQGTSPAPLDADKCQEPYLPPSLKAGKASLTATNRAYDTAATRRISASCDEPGGSQGEDVSAWQFFLRDIDLFMGDASGTFDAPTRAATQEIRSALVFGRLGSAAGPRLWREAP